MNQFLEDYGVPLGICAGVLAAIWGAAWVAGIQAQLLQ